MSRLETCKVFTVKICSQGSSERNSRLNPNLGVSSINEFAEFAPNPNVVQIPDAVEELMERYSSRRSVTMQGDMTNSMVGSLRRSNTG